MFFLGGIGRYLLGRRAFPRAERFAFDVPLFWLALGLVGLSLAASKRELYLTPLLPAAAAISGLWLETLLEGRATSRYARLLPTALAALLALGSAALPAAAAVFHIPLRLPVLGGIGAAALAATLRRSEELERQWRLEAAAVSGAELGQSDGQAAVRQRAVLGTIMAVHARRIVASRKLCTPRRGRWIVLAAGTFGQIEFACLRRLHQGKTKVSIGGGDNPILFASHQAPRRASSMSLCLPQWCRSGE